MVLVVVALEECTFVTIVNLSRNPLAYRAISALLRPLTPPRTPPIATHRQNNENHNDYEEQVARQNEGAAPEEQKEQDDE
jgi:hypothetical protein